MGQCRVELCCEVVFVERVLALVLVQPLVGLLTTKKLNQPWEQRFVPLEVAGFLC